MYYGNGDYSFWGMNLIWWVIMLVLFIWIFATPYEIPGQRRKKESPFENLKRRYAEGEINTIEFKEQKSIMLGSIS